uniref:HPS5-like beta-propeller domain-containing protein n=1 Tax=Ascaris lumbricoides TaxID=6252 RepID=A0A9J2PK95_ASCLU
MSSAPIPDRSLRITATTSSSRVSKSNETQIPASNSDESSGRVEVTHVFLELTSLDELSFPTSSSSRIKYTCLDASPHYLAVGSSSGTVYLFSRYASKNRNRLSSVPVQIVSTKDGPVVKAGFYLFRCLVACLPAVLVQFCIFDVDDIPFNLVHELAISPDEKYLVSASQRGPLTISALSNVGHSPTTVVSNTCHVGNVESGQPNHVTELRWSDDSRKIYAGDLKGQVSCTRIQVLLFYSLHIPKLSSGRKLFRSPCDVLLETDSEVVQIDVREECLLVSTLTRCCLCDLTTLHCVQVGKKLRQGRFGAMFYPKLRHHMSPEEERNLDAVAPHPQADNSTSPALIFASRPNGRLWEANSQGVVYRSLLLGLFFSTHQYRNLSNISRFPIISFKEDFSRGNVLNEPLGKHLIFGRLHLIDCQRNSFVLTSGGSSLYLIDPTDGRFVLACDIDKNARISEYAVCGSDIFILSDETGKLRKLSLFTLQKAVEKLHWKQCFNQAAELICTVALQTERSGVVPWRSELLQDILTNSINSSANVSSSGSECTATQREALQKLLDLREQQRSREEVASQFPSKRPRAVIHRLSTGIHRVVRIMDNSGYEDDFTFRAPSPLRQRSKSTPNIESSLKTVAWKRRSVPLKQSTPEGPPFEEEGDDEEHDAEQMRKQRIQEAFHLLASCDAESSNKGCLAGNGSADSLRTLLACGEQRVTFHSQVTLGDVPRDLIAAKKLLRLIADDEEKSEAKKSGSDDQCSLKQADHSLTANLSTDFACLFGRRDPLEGLSGCATSHAWSTEPVNVERMTVVKRPRKGARIVKAIKPLGRPVCITAEGDIHLSCNPVEGNDDYSADNGSKERLTQHMNNEHVAMLENKEMWEAVKECVHNRNSHSPTKVVINEGKLVVTSPINEPNLVTNVSTQHLDNSSPTNGANAVKNRGSNTLISSSYVIENNFVTDNKIRVSWSMASPTQNTQRHLLEKATNFAAVTNEDRSAQKKDVGHVRTSEKDDLSEDDTDERLMEVSEVTVTPTTISSTAVEEAQEASSNYCTNCRLHRSWPMVMTFGRAMSQLKVVADEFVYGGVPSCVEQWARLLTYYVHIVPAPQRDDKTLKVEVKALCEECAAFFDFGFQMKRKIVKMTEWLNRARKGGQEDKRAENIVRTSALAFDETMARKLFFKNDSIARKGSSSVDVVPSTSDAAQPPSSKWRFQGTRGCSFAIEMKNESDKNSVVINISSEVMKPSQQIIEREKDVTPTYLLNFAWISALTLSQLLLCMRLCEGIDAVFGLLMDNAMVMDRLSQQDWQWLAVLKAAEVERWKEIMPRQVHITYRSALNGVILLSMEIVDGLLSELNIVSIKDVGPDLSDSKSEFSKRFHLGVKGTFRQGEKEKARMGKEYKRRMECIKEERRGEEMVAQLPKATHIRSLAVERTVRVAKGYRP